MRACLISRAAALISLEPAILLFVISDGRNGTGSGLYNLSGGKFHPRPARCTLVKALTATELGRQTGGTVLDKNWFVVGRENATGTVNISGGTFTRSDGGTIGDENGSQTSIGDSPSNSGLRGYFQCFWHRAGEYQYG